MNSVVVTLKIMPETPEVDLEALRIIILKHIEDFAGAGQTKYEIQPVAFGLKSLTILFVMDEAIGSTEALENKITELSGVQSVECTDVRRAIG